MFGAWRYTRFGYTITHAIEDANVLRFHVDCYKPEGKNPPKPGEALAKRAVIEAILAKHDTATAGRRFNAVLATASINDAIEYHGLFGELQEAKREADPGFRPLNFVCVFSPPAEDNADVKQLQQDLPQEEADNEDEPDQKKAALKIILADYKARYGIFAEQELIPDSVVNQRLTTAADGKNYRVKHYNLDATVSHAQMEGSTQALYLDIDQRRKQQEAAQADQQDEAGTGRDREERLQPEHLTVRQHGRG